LTGAACIHTIYDVTKHRGKDAIAASGRMTCYVAGR
jgi:hypothetical protein